MNIGTLWEQAKLNGGMNDSPDSRMKFVSSVNSVIVDLNLAISADLDDIDDVTGTISCSAYCNNALASGVPFYLQRAGAWAREKTADSAALYDAAMTTAKSGKMGEITTTRNMAAD